MNLRALYREQEELRLEHNATGLSFREGSISAEEWDRYIREDFMPRSKEMHRQLGVARNLLVKSIDFEVQSITSRNIAYPIKVNSDEKRHHYLLLLERRLLDAGEGYDDGELMTETSKLMGALIERFKAG